MLVRKISIWLTGAVSSNLDLTNSCPALASNSTQWEGGSRVSHGEAQRGILTQQALQEAHSGQGDMMAGLNPV